MQHFEFCCRITSFFSCHSHAVQFSAFMCNFELSTQIMSQKRSYPFVLIQAFKAPFYPQLPPSISIYFLILHFNFQQYSLFENSILHHQNISLILIPLLHSFIILPVFNHFPSPSFFHSFFFSPPHASFQMFQPKDYVIKENTIGTKMYFIQEGAVSLSAIHSSIHNLSIHLFFCYPFSSFSYSSINPYIYPSFF